MRIAFLTPEYITETNFDGGLANYLYRVAQGLTMRGHHIEVFTQAPEDKTIEHRGILLHKIRTKNFISSALYRITFRKFPHTIQILSLSASLRRKFLMRHQAESFDIIQTSSYLSCGLFLTFHPPVPIISRVSSYAPLWRTWYQTPLTWDQRLQEKLEGIALKRSHAVYAPSKFLSAILQREKGIHTDTLLPPFMIDVEQFNDTIYTTYLTGKKYYLFFGTLGLLKGCEILAKALPQFLTQHPDTFFIFVGKDDRCSNGGSMIAYIRQQLSEQKKQIMYFGKLPHEQLYPIIKYAWAVVLPSLVDNLPNAMLESMALGTIVIGTYGTSFEELITHNSSGFLAQPGDSDELCHVMEYVQHLTEEQRKAICHRAQEHIKLLSVENTCTKLENYYQQQIETFKTLYRRNNEYTR